MASSARAGQLHAAHVCSLHVARGRRQGASLFFHRYISSKKDNSHWDFFFFLCDLCHGFTCVVASRERLEPSRAVKYRRLVGETTGSAVCEKCVYQSRLQAVNTVCETSTQRRRRLLSAHLPLFGLLIIVNEPIRPD